MKTAQRSLGGGIGVIILDEVYGDPGVGEGFLAVGFREEAALIAVPLGADDLDVGNDDSRSDEGHGLMLVGLRGSFQEIHGDSIHVDSGD